jgi:hypothetical protein
VRSNRWGRGAIDASVRDPSRHWLACLQFSVLIELAVQRGFADAERPRRRELVPIQLGDSTQDCVFLQICNPIDACSRSRCLLRPRRDALLLS